MYHNTLLEYKNKVAACRFCPMCKPAAEVANVVLAESYSTRSRAILLWRWSEGVAEPAARDIELLYQSTLDSISESWCVSHYPVSAYVLAARRRVVAEGKLPQPVQAALARSRPDELSGDGDTLFVSGEIWELDQREPWLSAAAETFERLGIAATVAVVGNGVIDFTLGDNARALSRLKELARIIAERQPKLVVADGPDTLFALTKLLPNLADARPTTRIVSLTELVADLDSEIGETAMAGTAVFCHDTRSACFLADAPAEDGALLPEFAGPEEALGRGAVFDHLRTIVRAAGGTMPLGPWMRTLAKSAGADDGLWLTYPRLAETLGRARFAYARSTNATSILTDSPLTAAHLGRLGADDVASLPVRWTAELVRQPASAGADVLPLTNAPAS